MKTTTTREPAAAPQGTSEFQEVIKLTRLAGMLSRPFFQRFARQYKISLNEWRALVLIVRSPEIASQDIAEFTGMHAMNVSRAVAGLRSKGRVTSQQDPENHRRQLLSATDAGIALVEELMPSAEGRASRVFSVLSAEERVALSGMLDRLMAQSEAVLVEDGEDDASDDDHEAGADRTSGDDHSGDG